MSPGIADFRVGPKSGDLWAGRLSNADPRRSAQSADFRAPFPPETPSKTRDGDVRKRAAGSQETPPYDILTGSRNPDFRIFGVSGAAFAGAPIARFRGGFRRKCGPKIDNPRRPAGAQVPEHFRLPEIGSSGITPDLLLAEPSAGSHGPFFAGNAGLDLPSPNVLSDRETSDEELSYYHLLPGRMGQQRIAIFQCPNRRKQNRLVKNKHSPWGSP